MKIPVRVEFFAGGLRPLVTIMSINLKPHSLECGSNLNVLNFGS